MLTVGSLAGGDDGIYAVTTETSLYVLDLGSRRFRRTPKNTLASPIAADGARLIVSHDGSDNAWVQLVRLIVCEVGEPMILVGQLPGLEPRVWASTRVIAMDLVTARDPS